MRSMTALSPRTASLMRIPLVLIYIVPLVWLFVTAFKPADALARDPSSLVFHPTGEAFQSVMNDQLWRAMLVSTEVALGVTVGTMVLGIPAAYGLSRIKGKARLWSIGVLLLFQMIPPAASLIPLYRLLAIFGLLNSRVGLILVDMALLLPFAILLLRPFCLAVPREMEEASMLDGAGLFQLLRHVVLPMVRNGAFVVGAMTFIMAWGEFINAITFMNDPTLQPISALLSSQVTQFGVRWNNLMALAVVTALPLLVIYLMIHKRLQEGLTIGSGK